MSWLRSLIKVGTALLLTVLAVLVASGCKNPGAQDTPTVVAGGGDQERVDNGTPAPPIRDPLLIGDRIRLQFYGPPNPPQPHLETIRRDGFITPPLLGSQVRAAGKTQEELQDELHSLYVPAFYKTLTITVTAEERYFFVGGHVATPGMIPYRADMTLLKALQAAGDLTIWAARGRVSINRNDGRTEVYDVDQILKDPSLDPPVYAGDSVHAPRRVI
jgi:protein involved in polysaccharide export with SLBB domain